MVVRFFTVAPQCCLCLRCIILRQSNRQISDNFLKTHPSQANSAGLACRHADPTSLVKGCNWSWAMLAELQLAGREVAFGMTAILG